MSSYVCVIDPALLCAYIHKHMQMYLCMIILYSINILCPILAADSKSVHDATWLLIAGLVGGCIALLLAVLVVTGRKLYSKIRGNELVCLHFCNIL